MVSRLTASSPAHPRRYASSREASLAGTRVTCALSTRLNATPRAPASYVVPVTFVAYPEEEEEEEGEGGVE